MIRLFSKDYSDESLCDIERYGKVDRIVVVNHTGSDPFGRVFDIRVDLSLQDGGRTLKVFVNERVK